MILKDVIAEIPGILLDGDEKTPITGLAYSSKTVRPGFLFAALKGLKSDGNRYIDEAIKRGASAVLSEENRPGNVPVAWIRASDPREALAYAAANFYGRPSMNMTVVGITGTKGKTTVAYLLESILMKAGFPAGVIGTINYRWGDTAIPAGRTTPEAPDLQHMLRQMLDQGIRYCLIEVSSHALDLKRVWGVQFDLALFTNLSQEHLDYHPSIEDYFEAKKKLFFLNAKKRTAVVNHDDVWGKRLMTELPLKTVSFGLEPAAIVRGHDYQCTDKGIKAFIDYPGGQLKVCSRLLGEHNFYNILAAAAASLTLNVPVQAIQEGISALRGIPGRLERIPTDLGFQVFVDYAHTDTALRRLLETARSLKPKRILLVFGAGGDRDKDKRPRMGEVAASLADVTFLTSDNPRSEDPLRIIAEIEQGFLRKGGRTYHKIPDRKEAIERALAAAKPGDYVLIAGKGHETVQVVKTDRIPFDDAAVARAFLRAKEARA